MDGQNHAPLGTWFTHVDPTIPWLSHVFFLGVHPSRYNTWVIHSMARVLRVPLKSQTVPMQHFPCSNSCQVRRSSETPGAPLCNESELHSVNRSYGPPVVPFSPFFSCEGSPTAIDYRPKVGTLILTALIEDPVVDPGSTFAWHPIAVASLASIGLQVPPSPRQCRGVSTRRRRWGGKSDRKETTCLSPGCCNEHVGFIEAAKMGNRGNGKLVSDCVKFPLTISGQSGRRGLTKGGDMKSKSNGQVTETCIPVAPLPKQVTSMEHNHKLHPPKWARAQSARIPHGTLEFERQ